VRINDLVGRRNDKTPASGPAGDRGVIGGVSPEPHLATVGEIEVDEGVSGSSTESICQPQARGVLRRAATPLIGVAPAAALAKGFLTHD